VAIEVDPGELDRKGGAFGERQEERKTERRFLVKKKEKGFLERSSELGS
jgi:hypothetical protein